ncbi:MAG: hypothetical protein ABSH24_19960 [Bryobacteraceae bacterium]|jgi:hypothetical protein
MFKSSRFALILGLAGAMAWLPSLSAQQKDPDEAGVAEAIRYERAKQAAADRQARIEEGRERGEKSADRSVSEPRPKAHPVKSAAATHKVPPPEHN